MPRNEGDSLCAKMTLQTLGLILRQRRDGNARALFDAYCSDPLCARYLARRAHTDVAQTEKVLLDYCQASKSTPGAPFAWVISLKTSEAPIGLFIANPYGHRTEIYFGVSRLYWGRGLVVEAGKAALAALWTQPQTQRVWAVCDVEHTRSRRVLEKLGMQSEGVLRKWLLRPQAGVGANDCFVFFRNTPRIRNEPLVMGSSDR